MKVLLVKPPTPLKTAQRLEGFLHLEPLALEIVAAGINPRQHTTRILDLMIGRRTGKLFVDTLREFQPDVVGCSRSRVSVTAIVMARVLVGSGR